MEMLKTAMLHKDLNILTRLKIQYLMEKIFQKRQQCSKNLLINPRYKILILSIFKNRTKIKQHL